MDDGRMAGEGRCSCRCITIPGFRTPHPPASSPRRPIAKFNAKVMRARVRLRAAMQERPAAGSRQAVSASPTTALHTASPFRHWRVPAGHLTNNYSSVKIITMRPSRVLRRTSLTHLTTVVSLLPAGNFRWTVVTLSAYQRWAECMAMLHFRDVSGSCRDRLMCYSTDSAVDATPYTIMQYFFKRYSSKFPTAIFLINNCLVTTNGLFRTLGRCWTWKENFTHIFTVVSSSIEYLYVGIFIVIVTPEII